MLLGYLTNESYIGCCNVFFNEPLLQIMGATDEVIEVAVSYFKIVGIPVFSSIHELSMASATFTGPVNALSKTAWQNVVLIDTMNDSSITLQRYCTIAGLTPVGSEWWHFNDIDAMNEIVSNSSDGDYLLSDI